MKKITLIAAAAAALLLASCSSGESSSAAETTASTTTTTSAVTEAVSSDDTSEEPVDTKGELAKAYTEKIKGGVFAYEADINVSNFGETPLSVKVNGDDIYVKKTTVSIDVEVYQTGGKAYNLMPAMKTYVVSDATTLDQQGVSDYALSSNATFVKSYKQDGFTVEEFEVPVLSVDPDVSLAISLDAGSNTVKYCFDDSGELKKIITDAGGLGDTVIVFKSLTFENVSIEMPDLTDWTEMKSGEQLDKVSTIKMGLARYGVTEEMVTAAGYTYEQLAEMEEQEVTDILVKIAEDNGLDFDPDA
ncbi:MAG: hypothetical protein IKP47_04675 [Ruminococcus sp.]|nr:hypothetical protein [Ruminococcus sp.]